MLIDCSFVFLHAWSLCYLSEAASVTDRTSELHPSWVSLQQWTQEAQRKKYQVTPRASLFIFIHPFSSSVALCLCSHDISPPYLIFLCVLQGTDLPPASKDKQPETQTDVIIREKDAPAVESNMRAALQNLLLSPEGGNNDQEPQGKTSVFLSESKQRAGLVDGSQAVQTEKGLQGKGEEGSHHHTEETSQSSGSHITDKPKVGRLRPFSQWCHYLAWTLCVLSWLSCSVVSAVLGTR